jgi:hypothetical protein
MLMLDSYQIAFLFPEQWLIPLTLKNYIYVLKDRETLVGPIGDHFPNYPLRMAAVGLFTVLSGM